MALCQAGCILVLLVAFLGLVPSGASAAPDPMTCSGYPEPRVYLESQSWWRGTPPGDTQVRHVHSGACFPYKQVLDGVVTIDVVTKLHEYEGWMLRFVRVQVASDQDGGSRTLGRAEPRRVCDAHDCTFVTPVTVDLSTVASGTWEFRIHSEARPGIVSEPWNLATNGWVACVRSCEGRTPKAVDAWETEGRGYYRTTHESIRGYVNGRFLDDLPWDPASGQLEAKRGTWCPNVRTLRGAGDEPVSDTFIALDPSFHAVPEDRGRVLLERPGTFRGPLCLDTTQLDDGQHKLFIQSSWNGGDEQLWGAIVVPFEVANGGPPPPPPPEPACSNGLDDDGDGLVDYPEDPGCTASEDSDESTALPAPGPSVRITRPAEGQLIGGSTRFDVTTSAEVVRVEYLVDGAVVAWDGTSGNGFDEPWTSTTVANGMHQLIARAYDGAGGSVDSAPVAFSVSN